MIATVAIFVLPMYEGVNVTVASSGERTEEHLRKTLLEMQSLEPITILFFSAIVIMSLAAIFCAIRAGKAKDRVYGMAMIALGLLLLFAAFISGFSVGGFYLPSAVMVFFAGILLSASSK